MTYRTVTSCRFCGAGLRSVIDLGKVPIANALCSTQEEALAAEIYPLELLACRRQSCGLYQLSIAVEPGVLFPPGYTYATPNNPELVSHYRRVLSWLNKYVPWPQKFRTSHCVEIGSNNGAFLVAAARAGWVCTGVEPSSIPSFVPTVRAFFTEDVAKSVGDHDVDLVIARHCLAHIDNVQEILRGVEQLLSHHGVFYIENAYAVDTLGRVQFDQLYHEHLSYFTVRALQRLLPKFGMKVRAVHLFPHVHGGSIGVACSRASGPPREHSVSWLSDVERREMSTRETHFIKLTHEQVLRTRRDVEAGGVVDAWGASAKAVTRFACAGITHRQVRQCIDDSPVKQGKFLPGSGIPIVAPGNAWSCGVPDALYLTAWNYERSLRVREAEYLARGGKFIVP